MRAQVRPGEAVDPLDYRVRNATQAVNNALHELKLAHAARDAGRRASPRSRLT